VPIQPKPPTAPGPAEWFTGDVFIDAIARGEEPSRVRVSAVRFTPSARTAWHAHAVGQTLYVTEGRGLVQSRGGPVEEIRAGDIISTPPDQWHWHGAAPDHYMTHLSITEAPADQRPRGRLGRTRHRRRVLPTRYAGRLSAPDDLAALWMGGLPRTGSPGPRTLVRPNAIRPGRPTWRSGAGPALGRRKLIPNGGCPGPGPVRGLP
jgi:quercetin dioxygenase-like cupin family protein